MTILQSLTRAYDRLAARQEVPSFGYSTEKISFCLSLNLDGSLAGPPIDLRYSSGKKLFPQLMDVPASFKRPGVTPRPFFLWDNSAFCLGVSADENKDAVSRFEVFRERHLQFLGDNENPSIRAFCEFIRLWKPEMFNRLEFSKDIKDKNIIFALNSSPDKNFLHQESILRALWANFSEEWKAVPGKKTSTAVCLVTGQLSPIARTHPAIRGVSKDADSIVSFNLDAFTSYGHEQGDNAPVWEAAAFAYTTALNKFLEKGSHNRVQIGDASTVFWAEAPEVETATLAESMFTDMFEVDETAEAKNQIKPILEAIRKGEPLYRVAPKLAEGVKFYVLGLAPNAARISIRFWHESSFGDLTQNYQRFLADMQLEPTFKDEKPVSLKWYLRELAVLRKDDNVPPRLGGDWMRAILTGTDFPLTLLSLALTRIRAAKKEEQADMGVLTRRVRLIKSVLVRNKLWEAPVALDEANLDVAYNLGRLFAVLEKLQRAALGENINASIKDKFYGSASANPRSVFPILIRLSIHHQSKALKGEKRALAGFFIQEIAKITNNISTGFPSTLSLHQQGNFALGYYHQHFKKKPDAPASETVSEGTNQ